MGCVCGKQALVGQVISFMGRVCGKRLKDNFVYEEPTLLAIETQFTVNEVVALYELFKKISQSIIKDGRIQKEEFQLALFRNSNRSNLFADRIFEMFDVNSKGVIEFGDFVRSLNIFHPNTSEDEKIDFTFRLYDLRSTGYIEQEELKEMVLALFHESDLCLSEDDVEKIVEQTYKLADIDGDGKIDPIEWKKFVKKNPSLLKNMTLPYLMDITTSFPSFENNNELDDVDGC